MSFLEQEDVGRYIFQHLIQPRSCREDTNEPMGLKTKLDTVDDRLSPITHDFDLTETFMKCSRNGSVLNGKVNLCPGMT